MPPQSREVAKVMIMVELNGSKYYLFSKKNALGKKKHRRLELLGGEVDDESPVEALIRELAEEERSGLLAEKARHEELPVVKKIDVNKTTNYLFRISISFAEYLDIEHDEAESLGFKLVPRALLSQREFQARLTTKTAIILNSLNPSEWWRMDAD